MKFAVLSDIHGNALSLRLALADARAQGAEGYLFVGDYCISAPWANECVHLMQQLPNARFVCGNDEQHLFVPSGDDGQFEVARWCAAELTPEHHAWLDRLPETLDFTCEGVRIHMAHSSEAFVGKSLHAHFRTATLPERYPTGSVSREALLADFRQTLSADASFTEAVHRLEEGVYLFGHNHIQANGCFDGRWMINPGSCGMPLDCGDFCAAYALLTVRDGQVSVEERRIPYDVEALIAQVRETPQYAAARVWSETIFSEWRTCREKVASFLYFTEDYARRIGDPRRPFAKDTWQAAHALFVEEAPRRWPHLFVR